MDNDLEKRTWGGIIAHYRQRLDIRGIASPVTLLEGNTPLIFAPKLAQAIGIDAQLWLKYEGLNPTGSFKDRGMTAAITQARADGAQAVICASTGNTAASAAAYSARAGLRCFVLVPAGKIAVGKLAGALIYGADVIAIEGSFDEAMALVRKIAEELPIAIVNSINPARMQGQKTAAFEICDALAKAPDWHCLPIGNAGNITAYWMGYTEYYREGLIHIRPRLLGAQAAGAAPFVKNRPIDKPETIATAIRIGHPVRWQEAVNALQESNGQVCAVEDAEILDAYRLIAATEGIFCEPSSAASVAALIKKARLQPHEFAGKCIVCVLTGHGLKDPDIALKIAPHPLIIRPKLDELLPILRHAAPMVRNTKDTRKEF